MLITEKKKIDTFYKALLNREQSFVGIFFVGVKTTSVFCIATCRARKPKLENVEFYTTFKEALDNGYRPCKICKPTQNANEAPEQVATAMELVKNHPKEKITDYKLRQQQISPEVVRRWFKKNYGMTFHAYQRMVRINNAFMELKSRKKVTATAFDTGYESLSGFGYTYKKLLGDSPQNSLDKNIILISRLTSPIGPMFVCATDHGICLLEFVDRRMLETEFKDLQRLLKAKIITGEKGKERLLMFHCIHLERRFRIQYGTHCNRFLMGKPQHIRYRQQKLITQKQLERLQQPMATIGFQYSFHAIASLEVTEN